MGRFINADALVTTGQGLLGNNMFAYCRNNPVCRRDISGATDEKCYEGVSDPLGDDEKLTGGKMGNGSGVNGTDTSQQSTGGTQKSVANGRITGYTKHGLNQAIARDGVGVKPSSILDTVRNPIKVTTQSGGRTKYLGHQAVVVVNSDGRVITTYPKSSMAWRSCK